MKLEAVVVCVRYSDFLAWSLPLNRHFFDRMVVVTDSKDKRTQKLCEYWHVQCVVTDAFYEDGSPFNKGKGINEGLKALDGDAWVLHLDADIVLPPQFRSILEGLKLDPDGLYHADRMMCDSFDKWLRFFVEPVISNEANIYVHPRPFPLGVRLNKSDFGGWLPLGYFQMWNQGRKKLTYPIRNDDAGHSDLRFAELFSREHRHMLAEFFVTHLETKMSGKNEMGSNWRGRKTPSFGPAPVETAIEVEKKEVTYSERYPKATLACLLLALALLCGLVQASKTLPAPSAATASYKPSQTQEKASVEDDTSETNQRDNQPPKVEVRTAIYDYE